MRTQTLLLISAMSALSLMAAGGDNDKGSVTGCLSKTATGEYALQSEAGKPAVTVTGSADLEKHSANHKVTLHGKEKMENGQPRFHVERVEHVADTCSPTPAK